ncbi:FAD-binding domain-containing protein [Crucibulum laeve]|uniref:FAD-binding domain-containing protein n=1 Tax=Crucibulum laeve TaxID=68775 RepID=A0A5C3LNY1_9AGAR|nr:FAD-binding domain-containing protein [Crucibulum laeve]
MFPIPDILLDYKVALSTFLLLSSNHSSTSSVRDIVCSQIAHVTTPGTKVYYPGHNLYAEGISHWANGSGTQESKCVVEPVSADDIGSILKVIGATRTPFAVKGSGHHTGPGFSSTKGVQISMRQFTEVKYNKESQTVDIGPGLLFDDVYEALEPHGVNVVGARAMGVGVPGFVIGGGYSWLSNQHGLSMDTVLSYELVKPTGEVVEVTQESEPDLFFAIKGGGNNFGIVTRFTMRAFPQGQVWGGVIKIDGSQIPLVGKAVTNFSNNIDDPKAGMDTLYTYAGGKLVVVQLVFYDGPVPPAGIFEDMLAIPSIEKDVSTRNFWAFLQAGGPFPTESRFPTLLDRSLFHTFSLLTFSPTLSEVIKNETEFWGSHLSTKSGEVAIYAIEPFHPEIYSHNTTATAFPSDRSVPFYPYVIWFSWTDESQDEYFYAAAKESANRILEVAEAEGQHGVADLPLYSNPALFDTPLERIYGTHVPRLREIKAKVDPENVMGLAGGFKF